MITARYQTLEAYEAANEHRCDDECQATCDFCASNDFCMFEEDAWFAHRIGDSNKHNFICAECERKRLAGAA